MQHVAISLSMLVLNSRDRQENLWLFQKHFPSKFCHKIYWYDAISTIYLFKKLKRALELKLLNFKISGTAGILSHSLTTTIDLPPKLLGLRPPSFPSMKFIFVHTNL